MRGGTPRSGRTPRPVRRSHAPAGLSRRSIRRLCRLRLMAPVDTQPQNHHGQGVRPIAPQPARHPGKHDRASREADVGDHLVAVVAALATGSGVLAHNQRHPAGAWRQVAYGAWSWTPDWRHPTSFHLRSVTSSPTPAISPNPTLARLLASLSTASTAMANQVRCPSLPRKWLASFKFNENSMI